MRSQVSFHLNGVFQELTLPPHMTVLELLRGPLMHPGTKEGCGEGDCGTCTVVIGEKRKGAITYRAVTSCLMMAAQLDGKHLITIEGLSSAGTLHPIQQCLIENHATQCGYCTPGVALSLFALLIENPKPDRIALQSALEGNLCRCTGYYSIRKAGQWLLDEKAASRLPRENLRPRFLDETEKTLLSTPRKPTEKTLLSMEKGGKSFHIPTTTAELLSLLGKFKDAVFFSGGTDLTIAIKKHHAPIHHLIDLGEIEEMQKITIQKERIRIGGTARLCEIIDDLKLALPALSEALSEMCSNQVRTLATLAGNISNASPVADAAPVLLALGAEVELTSSAGIRTLPIEKFYLGYKKTDRKPHEWISAILVPRREDSFVHFEKASKRKALDIATVNSALALSLKNQTVSSARLCFGGVGPTTILASKASAFLCNKPWTLETAKQAAVIAAEETTPISDLRGSREGRLLLIRNLMIKHFLASQSRKDSGP